ncbi:bifunctional UDP-sugar hydrolase/5'-nucleotidase [Sphingobium sp. MP9-4]|uniref:bifunctional metallophosphatase/5'-nucleotidase n=2 Tax=Sphingobium TaxID=165695 RepID=UPI0019CF5318|nr:bifunctional UDP-sugar hydrolase/5'-nucleotidase [Sphingobium sp. MP9-4]
MRGWLAGLVLATMGGGAVEAKDRSFTILHTNDMHGRHAPITVAPGNATSQTGDTGRTPVEFARTGRIGGFAALAGVVERTRREQGPANVLLVDAGDTFSDDFVGNATRGETMIRLMNQLGYQFMALGNHDFDYGLERTRELQALATFPMRGANTLEKGSPVFGEPWKIFEAGGVRIAMLALSYHNTGLTGSKSNVEGLTFANGIETTRRYLPRLREQADIVVLLSHQGTAVDRKLAREVPGVDIIIGGHSHDLIAPAEKIGGTWIVQALSDAAMIGRLTVVVGAGGRIRQLDSGVVELWNDQHPDDPAMAAAVAREDGPYRREMDEVLATATDRIGRRYKSESPFDALVGMILREETGADVAFMPGVGYGVSIEPGPVTRDRLYTLLPHPTKLVTLTMTGAQVRSVLEQSATNLSPDDDLARVGGLVQTSGIAWTADLNRPAGNRITHAAIDGRAIEPQARYKVATNAGMLDGLHRYTAFAQGEDIHTDERSVTAIVEGALRRMKVVAAPASGAVRIVASSAS